MNKNKLLERQKFVSGRPLPNRVASSIFSRRTGNYVVMESDSDETLDNSFFDFEDDLSGMTPAAEQFAKAFSNNSDTFGPLEEREEIISESIPSLEENQFSMILEENDELLEDDFEASLKYPNEEMTEIDSPLEIEGIAKFEFIQCSFHKDDGTRCKRQAPKGKDICASHQKMLDKRSK